MCLLNKDDDNSSLMVVVRMKCQCVKHFGWFLAQSKYSISVAYIY